MLNNGLSYIATHARCKYPLAERRAGEGCEIKIPFLLSREHEKIKLANPIPAPEFNNVGREPVHGGSCVYFVPQFGK